MPTVRCGLIGYGAWGQHHARALTSVPEASLTAIAANSEASVAKDDTCIEGFIEENIQRYRWDLQGFERTLVFAEDSLGFYALDIDRGMYRVESWGGIVIREFATFEELLEEALSTVMKDLDA
jgi:hypothetical protein